VLKGHADFVFSAEFSPDGGRVVIASPDGTARVWDAADGRPLAELRGHAGPVYTAAFSPDGGRVVTASADRTARVWGAADGMWVAELRGHTNYVYTAAFGPDGGRVVTTSLDMTARVWTLEPLTGEAATIPRWVQAFTGTELKGGTVRPLSAAEWKALCRELRAYGTKAPPSPWLDGLDLAEQAAGR
jgi:WD40 repeat protein